MRREKPKSNPQNILHAIPQALNFESLRIIHYYLIFNFFSLSFLYFTQNEITVLHIFFKLNLVQLEAFN